MSRFAEHAVQILEAAETALESGYAPSQYSILLGQRGGIHLIADSDWPLDSLQREHGAASAFRVTTASGRVTVDGRQGSRTCRFETPAPASVAQFLLNSVV